MANLSQAKKVLVIRFLGIGDVLFTTPMLRFMKKMYPNLEITYLTSTLCAPILQGNLNINKLITYNMPSMEELVFHPLKLLRLLKLIIILRRKKIDVTIITHRSFFAILFAFLIGSATRIGFDYKGWGWLLNEKIPLSENRYAPELYMGLLRPDYNGEEDLKLELCVSNKDKAYANTILNSNQKDIIAIAPGGGSNAWMDMSRKRWSIAEYANVTSSLVDKYDILLLGGKDDEVISIELKEIVKFPVIDLTGKTTLPQAAALLQRCKLFIGNDSSLLHIAVAMAIPTISIFGPTNPAFFAPRGDKHIVIKSNVQCSPCFDYGSLPECEEHICMTSVKAEEVLSAVRKALMQ